MVAVTGSRRPIPDKNKSKRMDTCMNQSENKKLEVAKLKIRYILKKNECTYQVSNTKKKPLKVHRI